MSVYKNKKVAIIGMSVEGTDSAKFFEEEGAIVTSRDRQMGPDYLVGLETFDLVVRTPGMLLATPELAKAKQLTSLTKLFFEHCKAKIIGVTGTKGKGTTCTLIYEMLKQSGKRVFLGGNVGVPLLSQVRSMTADDLVVLELSSFQLEDLKQSPHIAVVLTITEDHLANYDPNASNFHESRLAYIEAKKSIVRYQTKDDVAIVNADSPTSLSFAKETPARVLYVRRTSDTTVYLGNEIICSLSEMKLRGKHNLDNIAAAALAANIAGATLQAIRTVAKDFRGLEHRLETVRTVNGVLYINDSFSTVPETSIAAIESFENPLILIVGGSEKGSDFRKLGKKILKSNVKALIVVGRMTDRILAAVTGYTGEIVTGLKTMKDIVLAAHGRAVEGDVVLLSPACASFDMFENYKERGNQFKHEVSIL